MSVKIYNGLITTVADPFQAGEQIRRVLAPLFLSQFKQIHDAYKEPGVGKWSDLPRYFDDDKELPKHNLPEKLHKKIVALHGSSTWTFSDADIYYDVTLVPNNAGGNTLAFVFGEKRNDYTTALIQSGVVEEYGYWNNSDKPDDVSKEEWNIRKKAWSSLENATPAEVGLSFRSPSWIDASVFLSEHGSYASRKP